MNDIDRTDNGQIPKGERLSPETEFQEGQHWRDEKPYWHRWWLHREYILFQRSAGEIADDWNVTEGAIRYWLDKHDVKTRSISEARNIKYWGASGQENGMYGRTGPDSPNWRGGVTPERQKLYASQEWKNAVRKVWMRDEAECQRCGMHADDSEEPFHCHHIIPFATRKHRAEPSNLLLLCPDCHWWVHRTNNQPNKYIQK